LYKEVPDKRFESTDFKLRGFSILHETVAPPLPAKTAECDTTFRSLLLLDVLSSTSQENYRKTHYYSNATSQLTRNRLDSGTFGFSPESVDCIGHHVEVDGLVIGTGVALLLFRHSALKCVLISVVHFKHLVDEHVEVSLSNVGRNFAPELDSNDWPR
jgi:hypothetical protein